MSMHRDLDRLDVLPASFLDALQQFLSTHTSNLRFYLVNSTTVGVDYGGGNELVAVGVEGRWRFRGEEITDPGPPPVWTPASGTLSAAHPGGAAGNYDLWIKAHDNVFADTPNPDTDNTDYKFYFEIRATGSPPNSHALKRKIATVQWSGSAIERIIPLGGDVLTDAKAGSFSAYRSTDLISTSMTGTPPIVVFNAEEYDTSGTYNVANGRWTPPFAGIWEIKANVCWSEPAEFEDNSLQAWVYKNGAIYRQLGLDTQALSTSAEPMVGGAVNVVSDGDDYFEVRVTASGHTGGGGTGTLQGDANGSRTWCQGNLVARL